MLRLCTADKALVLETDYRSSRLIKLRAALEVELPRLRNCERFQCSIDVPIEFARHEAPRSMSALCLSDLPGFLDWMRRPEGGAAGFPVLLWGNFVVVFPGRSGQSVCVDCELALLQRFLSGFAKACELGCHLLNTPDQRRRGVLYSEHLLFQRTCGFGGLNDAQLLIGDARSGDLMVREIPAFSCAAHRLNGPAQSECLNPVVHVNHLSLPGFYVAEASVTDGLELGNGGAVDVSGSAAALRARYEAIERHTIRRLQGRSGGSAAPEFDVPLWIQNFTRAKSDEVEVSARRNVGFAAHTSDGAARLAALCEMLERKIVPSAYAHRRLSRIDEHCWVGDDLRARITRAGLGVRLYLCENELAPTVLAFTHDRRGRGSSATATAASMKACAESAILNALGMYVARSNAKSLLDVREAWCWDLAISDPSLEQFGFQVDKILAAFRPRFYVAPGELVDKFVCRARVVACSSEVGGYSYRHGAVPDEFWDDFSREGHALLRDQGALISLT